MKNFVFCDKIFVTFKSDCCGCWKMSSGGKLKESTTTKAMKTTTTTTTKVLVTSRKSIKTLDKTNSTVTNRLSTVDGKQKLTGINSQMCPKSKIPLRISDIESKTRDNRKLSTPIVGKWDNSSNNNSKDKFRTTSVLQKASRNTKTSVDQGKTSLGLTAGGGARGSWSSPFKSFISQGTRRRCKTEQFAYDLSADELKFTQKFSGPMKPLSQEDRELLQSGQRLMYLSNRYEYSPDLKYNFPEATSWRIGWLSNERRRCQETSN